MDGEQLAAAAAAATGGQDPPPPFTDSIIWLPPNPLVPTFFLHPPLPPPFSMLLQAAGRVGPNHLRTRVEVMDAAVKINKDLPVLIDCFNPI